MDGETERSSREKSIYMYILLTMAHVGAITQMHEPRAVSSNHLLGRLRYVALIFGCGVPTLSATQITWRFVHLEGRRDQTDIVITRSQSIPHLTLQFGRSTHYSKLESTTKSVDGRYPYRK